MADDFVTKDSGARAEFSNGFVRDLNEGKPRFDLLLPEEMPFDAQFLTRIAELMERGAQKYSERNWEKARGTEPLKRFKESALRHLLEWYLGVDDGEDHAAAVFFNLMGAEFVKWHLVNDEPKTYAVTVGPTGGSAWVGGGNSSSPGGNGSGYTAGGGGAGHGYQGSAGDPR